MMPGVENGTSVMEAKSANVKSESTITALASPAGSWLGKLEDVYNGALQEYVSNNPKSRSRFEAALEVMPGGNTRSVLHFDPFPIAFASGKSAHVTSVDGQEYLDCVSEYSAAFFGHSHPVILKAIEDTLKEGINLGGPGENEVKLARMIKDRFPSIDKLRFCNSGSEASTMALSLAINITKKRKILAFENGYHGGFIGFSDKSLPTNIPHDFVLGRFNDIEYTRLLMDHDLAAIIVEPMQGAGGMNLGTVDFLQFLRDSATKYGALLIFDEVVTSRLHINGLQGHFGITPDITTLGKYLGGGPSFGAFGGRNDIMALLDPRVQSGLTHSGTYNNNILSMAAGVAAAGIVTPTRIEKANSLGDKLRNGLNSLVKQYKIQMIRATGFGSMVGIKFKGPAQDKLRDALFFHMLRHSIYLGRRGFISLNLVHEEKDIDLVLNAFAAFMGEVFIHYRWIDQEGFES